MKNLGILFLMIGLSFSLFAQELGKKQKEGKTYIMYAVKKGNTLYSLHQEYHVSVEAIKAANPSLVDGLKVGQIIYIPKVNVAADHSKVKIHIVARHETLYGISRMYDCKVKALIKLNPGVEKGIDVGQELKIPIQGKDGNTIEKDINFQQKFDSIQGDSIIQYKVNKGETMYSISRRFMIPISKIKTANNLHNNRLSVGQVINIPLKKEDTASIKKREVPMLDSLQIMDSIFVPKKSSYKILILLPMDLTKNPEIISGMYDENTELSQLTDVSIQFLMGAQMALDSLEKMGLSGEVKFYDTEKNETLLKKVLMPNNTSNWDIVVGPFFPELLTYAANWGKINHVPIISVTNIATQTLKDNPYLFSLVPSELTLVGGMAKFIAKNYPHANLVMITGKTESEKERIAYFKKNYIAHLPDSGFATIRMTPVGKASGTTLANQIQTEKKNFMICLSEDVQRVMQFVNALNAANNLSKKYADADVEMVGLKSWNNMTPLNNYYKNKFKFHFPSANYLNYDSLNVLHFVKNYRARYGSDPSKFAIHGFDVTLSQIASLILGIDINEGLMDRFMIHSLGNGQGHGNAAVFIIKQQDFNEHLLRIVESEIYFKITG